MEYPQKLLDLVDRINNGEWDELKPLFGDFDMVINLLSKFNMTHLLDPYDDNLYDIRNTLIYSLINSDNDEVSKRWMNSLIKDLGDISEINGQYYLDLSSLDELADWFESYSRDYSPRDAAKRVLSEDDDGNRAFYDMTDNVYRDVIEGLTPKNMKRLKEVAFETLNNKEIELDGRSSDLMDELVTEQGKEESFIVNSENIDRIINDEDTMLWFLKNDLGDLRFELYSLHDNAYNSAYESYLYRKVWDELKEYIDTDTKMDWYQHGKRYRVRLKVRREDLEGVIKEFFKQYKDYSDSFENVASYVGLVEKFMNEGPYDYLSFRIPDYPEYRDVENNINDFFNDYI